MASLINLPVTYHYAKLSTIFGQPINVIELCPKYTAKGNIDNRFVVLLGYNTNSFKMNLIVIEFSKPLVNLPPPNLVTAPGDVIPYFGFTSQQSINQAYNF
jgi:hypothetical protein